jgi:hypothetical protein
VTVGDPDARLAARLEHLRSDDRLRERAARAAEMTAEERLALTYHLGRRAMALLDALPPGDPARAGSPRELPASDAGPVLLRLARLRVPG